MPKPHIKIPPPTSQDLNRYWSRIDKTPGLGPTGECWEQKGNRQSRGYSQFWIQGVLVQAARFAYFLATGRDLGPLQACHTCDWPACRNPAHLFPGTQKQNMQDAKRKGRMASGDRFWARLNPEKLKRGDQHSARLHPETRQGARNGRAKLTEDDVRAIRKDPILLALVGFVVLFRTCFYQRTTGRRAFGHTVARVIALEQTSRSAVPPPGIA